jgi:medium-chain acyl-[acyl-carrier-protein] hydrolase
MEGGMPSARPGAARGTQPQSRWIAYRRPPGDVRLRLFCFHHAGGGASLYRSWRESMPGGLEVLPVQLPGRESRVAEQPFRSVDALLPALVEGLRPFMDVPFAFFGHSMGALVAFELARRLAAEGLPGPVHLWASGRRGPSVPDEREPSYGLPEPEFIEELRRLDGTPEEVLRSRELLGLILPLLRADLEFCETYRYIPGAPLRCGISALGGAGDPDVSREQLDAWRAETEGPFRLRLFPGGHFYLISDPQVVLRELGLELQAAVRRVS